MAKSRARSSQCRALYANSSLQAKFPRGIQKNRAIATRRSNRLQETATRAGLKAHESISRPVEESQLQSPARTLRLKRKRIDDEDEKPSAAHQRPKQTRSHLKKETKAHSQNTRAKEEDPIEFWSRERRWPPELFEIDEKTLTYIERDLDEERWIRDVYIPHMERACSLQERPGMDHVRPMLAKKRSSSSLRRKKSDAGSSANTSTPSDQKPREEKSAPYSDVRYETILATKSSFLTEDPEGVAEESSTLCRQLLDGKQSVPDDTLFEDDIFKDTYEEIRNRNEAKVIRDIAQLIVPSPRRSKTRGTNRYKSPLVESVNEGWNNSVPLIKPRPQSDYAVGFGRSAFSEEQLVKLAPFVGDVTDTSMFMATFYMYFPFLTCEIKCGAAALDIADRQNAHSMTLAVRGVVELFKLVRREKELDRQILAFSVSHDHRSVRIYGHYPVIEDFKTSFYRHPIHTFDFTALDGREKWTAYQFTKNVYDLWMPNHFKRLCSVIDDIPADVSFELSQQGDLQFQDTGLSQDFRSHSIAQSAGDSEPSQERDSEPGTLSSGKDTPDTSVSQPGPFKKPKKRNFSKKDA